MNNQVSQIEQSVHLLRSPGIPDELITKWQVLTQHLAALASVVVAYSGGVDSALLAFAAHLVLGERMMAVTVTSPLDPPEVHQDAAAFTAQYNIPHQTIELDLLSMPGIAANLPDRCYHCKLAILQRLWDVASKQGAVVIEGQNVDDEHDYRPGRRAVTETGTISPLADGGLTKADIRRLAQAFGLSVWDKPSSPCLASRIPYGVAITDEALRRVEQAERYLRDKGFKQVRVRHHPDLVARIEVGMDDIPAILNLQEELTVEFRKFGFVHVAIDHRGYRQGSLNEGVQP